MIGQQKQVVQLWTKTSGSIQGHLSGHQYKQDEPIDGVCISTPFVKDPFQLIILHGLMGKALMDSSTSVGSYIISTVSHSVQRYVAMFISPQ